MLDRHETEHKSFSAPDETRKFSTTSADGWASAWTTAPSSSLSRGM
jgi:hypothetical protein